MIAYDTLVKRGVTRLCHFTKYESLTHIVSSAKGILSSDSIRPDIKRVTDSARYDGELNFISCSVQYPNSWFLQTAKKNNTDKIFKEWVVVYIDIDIVKEREIKFCPGNASRSYGFYINDNPDEIESIFYDKVPTFSYPRPSLMLSSCPTDGQAEIMIKNNIPLKYITGIVVGNKKVAESISSMLKILEISHISIYIAPDILTPKWSQMIRSGNKPQEIKYEERNR